MKATNILTALLQAVLFVTVTARTAEATDYYVAVSGSYDSNGLTWNEAWPTITHALDIVPPGNVINIGAGEYPEALIITNAITLSGADSYTASNPPLLRHVSRTIIRPPVSASYSAMIKVQTNGVALENLTIDCGPYGSVVPDVTNGIYCESRPLYVSNCAILNVNGYGIRYLGSNPPPSPVDTDSLRGYFGYNMITNITHVSNGKATGIFLDHAPSTCEYNEISGINGTKAFAGIYVFECFYTSNMTDWVTINYNYFNDCVMAIWANKFGTKGEKINIHGNIITNGLIGIRVTSARGEALITSNSIAVSGASLTTNATPARGIWIQADEDPWDTVFMAETDHFVHNNTLIGSSTNADGTIGMLFEYDISTWPNMNNGVRAIVLNNSVYGFDYGVFIKSGTNDVAVPNDPLVEVVLTYNNFYDNISYGLFATGLIYNVDATNNWWGSIGGPTNFAANPVSTNVNYIPWSPDLLDTDSDGDFIPNILDDDDDNDGLSDTDEFFIYGTDPLDPDTDDDNMTDWEEVIVAGTSPTNPLSVFMFSSADWQQGTGFEVKWTSVTGRFYYLYRTTNLLTGFGAPLTNFAANPPENVFTDTTAIGIGPYFYRVTVTN